MRPLEEGGQNNDTSTSCYRYRPSTSSVTGPRASRARRDGHRIVLRPCRATPLNHSSLDTNLYHPSHCAVYRRCTTVVTHLQLPSRYHSAVPRRLSVRVASVCRAPLFFPTLSLVSISQDWGVGDFVAVQWRTETSTGNLTQCYEEVTRATTTGLLYLFSGLNRF